MSKAMNNAGLHRILVVDDASANLLLLTNLLTGHGYTVHPASDGELALEFVRSILPDLILLDIRMPGMDGYEVCRRLKADERTRSIPIIFISILEDERDKVNGFQAGGVDYITKPFQPEEILARVRTHLSLRELAGNLEQKVIQRTEELMFANERLQQEIAERKRAEEALRLNAERMETLLRLNQMTDATMDEIASFAFEAAVKVTRSTLGYLAFMNEDETVLDMQLWSREAMAECRMPGRPSIFPVETTGLWGEAVRQRRPIITNDYSAPNPWKKGTPEGHIRLTRHMNLPVIVGGKIVLVAGVGNKAEDYDEADVTQLTLLMEGMWRLIERKRAEEDLKLSQYMVDRASLGIFRGSDDARILSANDYWARNLGYTPEELCSMTFFDIDPKLTPESWRRHRRQLAATGSNTFESMHRRKDGTVFPVEVTVNYLKYGDQEFSCSFARDITERKRTERVIAARMRLLQFATTHTLDELFEATLDEVEALTGSLIGFYHFLEADQKTLRLQNRSTRTKAEFCKAEGKGLHYDVSEAGVWVDCIRERRPVIHNDYASLPHRKGMPPGHAPVMRELVVPVFRGDNIVAVLGVGNKPQVYTPQDVEMVSLLADFAWTMVERKQAEEALRESERKYRSIVEHAPFGITRSTRDGKLVSVNPALAAILKYDSAEELLETINHSSIQDVLFPRPSERAPLVEDILAGDSWHVFNNRLRCKDGSIVTCRVHSRRIVDEAGQTREFESFQENITDQVEAEQALRESEEKFRVLAETSPAAICLYQGERLIYANPAMEQLFGFCADELYRMKFWDWAHEDFKELIRARGLARLAGESVPGQYEARYVTKDGSEKYVLISVGVMEYCGRPTGVASFLDITERRQAEELIRASLREKEVLLKEIHHRVKNNLQIVSSLLFLQAQKIRDPELAALFTESQNRIYSMALAHEQLYQSKNLADVRLPEYVGSLVEEIMQVFRSGQKTVCCQVDVEDIDLDIEQVVPCGLLITELLSNALRHAFPGSRSGTVRVEMHRRNELLSLTVGDDGVGLPSDLDVAAAGTLGLQLVRALTDQLDGTLEVTGQEGAEFRVAFPARNRQGLVEP